MSKENWSRRDLLKGAAGLAAAAALPVAANAHVVGHRIGRGRDRRVLRFAHLTDIHLYSERHSPQGFAKCLDHVQGQADAPEFILNGGDSIFDGFSAISSSVKAQWKEFHAVLRQNCSLPVYHALGNHDIWGWDKKASRTSGSEPLHGKNWAMQELTLSKPYYSFDKAGWHFVILDSIRPARNAYAYNAKLDHEQFEWLRQDLQETPPTTPVVVMTHVPILSVSAYFRPSAEDLGYWNVPSSYMHIDARRIKDLFVQHPNVKLCLAGHEHLHGKVHYLGVTYSCSGAVSGNWWNGVYQETAPGYALVDLYADGSFKTKYVPWGWKA